MDREARAKASWQYSPIYTASHDAQGRWRGVHFGDRARGAKIGSSEEGRRWGRVENVSNGFLWRALWVLGARQSLKKGLKRPDGGLGCGGKGVPKTAHP